MQNNTPTDTLFSQLTQIHQSLTSLLSHLPLTEDNQRDIETIRKLEKNFHNNLNGIVYLNVGGVFIDTTMSTLCAVDSMLSVMVSGLFELTIDRNDRIFIDADGVLFKEHILPYLRRYSRGRTEFPERETMERRVWEEFEYFGLVPVEMTEEEVEIEFVGSQMLDIIGNEITKQKRCYGVAWSSEKYYFDNRFVYVLETVVTKVPVNGIIRIYMGIIEKVPSVNVFYSFKEGKYFVVQSAAVDDEIKLIIQNGELSMKQNDVILDTASFDSSLEYYLAIDLPWQNFQTTSLTIERFYTL